MNEWIETAAHARIVEWNGDLQGSHIPAITVALYFAWYSLSAISLIAALVVIPAHWQG